MLLSDFEFYFQQFLLQDIEDIFELSQIKQMFMNRNFQKLLKGNFRVSELKLNLGQLLPD